jgi:[protein-PII] uridylyltransferase
MFYSGVPATELVSYHAAMVDRLVVRAWRHIIKDDQDPEEDPREASKGIALVAVGGYGRGELHPASDIDILILLENLSAKVYQDRIEAFLLFLWDMGLPVSQGVRTLHECLQAAELDITVATNLMESRLLAGPLALFQRLRARIGPDCIWPNRRFFEAKLKEQNTRHQKYHDTAYNLEPNIKEGPGGLRDIQMIGWVAKRHFGVCDLYDLVGHGFLTESEYRTLTEGQAFLWRIRWGLHTLSRRREERLLFDYQRQLATLFGYRDEGPRLAVELFMKDYYQNVAELSRLNEMLLQLFQEAILYAREPAQAMPLNKRFQVRKHFLDVTHPDVFRRYPYALMELFLLMAQHPEVRGVRASTIRLVREHRYLIDDKFRADLSVRTLFMELLRQPRGVYHELRRMHRYGVLGAYLPVFGAVAGLLQHDLFHVYTVDEHSLSVVRNLRRFAQPQYAHEFPLCSELIQNLPKPELLYLAGLFHDIAKGRGGNHSELGAADALEFCLNHNLSLFDARFVSWLVLHHLVMSTTAQRKDVYDPQVIHAFAATVGDPLHLDYLYLLTVADIRATNPTLWNSWKDALLAELFLSTRRALRRGLQKPIDQAERIMETLLNARGQLERQAINPAWVEEFWQRLDEEYFLRHSADEIAWQTQAILNNDRRELPLVLVRSHAQRGGTEIFIYAEDQEHLFAVTTSALDYLGLNVSDARIVPTRDGYTLDTYRVVDESGKAIHDPYLIQEILSILKQRLPWPYKPGPLTQRRTPRRLKLFPIATEINFSQGGRNHCTVMEVIAADRPGLLARIGHALMEHGLRVKNAKIATLGARAEDVFYITTREGQPLTDEVRQAALREDIVKYLNEMLRQS